MYSSWQGSIKHGHNEGCLNYMTQIEETSNFIELWTQEVEESISEVAFILSITNHTM